MCYRAFPGRSNLTTCSSAACRVWHEVHLHDSPRLAPGQPVVYGKDHQPLGAGDLDVGHFLDRLAAANFSGPLIFELRVEQALASLDVIRSIRPGALQN